MCSSKRWAALTAKMCLNQVGARDAAADSTGNLQVQRGQTWQKGSQRCPQVRKTVHEMAYFHGGRVAGDLMRYDA